MNPPKHIVAVSALVTEPGTGRVLLVRSPRRGWEFPGGQVEEGESLTEALVREVKEETGITIAVSELIGVYSNIRSHIVMFGFSSEVVEGEPTTSAESLAVEWVPREEALSRVTSPPLHDRLRDMLTLAGTHQVIYRSYAFDALQEVGKEYTVHEQRII